MDDTIFALSSGRPPAAIAIIRVSGPQAHEALRLLTGKEIRPRIANRCAIRDPGSGELLDDALVIRFDSPASATGEDVVEFHCHGGRAVVAAVLAALKHIPGLREARPGEFTRRALINGRIDITEAEGLADLLEAESEEQRRTALLLADGGLRRQVAEWSDRILALSAAAERRIDYAEEDGDGVDEALAEESRRIAQELRTWLDRPSAGPLKHGVRVVFAGSPNSGKSSLINALSQMDRILVSEVPGTTRDVIEVPVTFGSRAYVLIDTAGLRGTDDRIEEMGIAKAHAEIERSDVVVWLDAHLEPPLRPRVIHCRSKSDLGAPNGDELSVSAHSGEGLDTLLSAIESASDELLPLPGTIALNDRHRKGLAIMAEELEAVSTAADDVLIAEHLRAASAALGEISGAKGIEPLLDALFARFCLGK